MGRPQRYLQAAFATMLLSSSTMGQTAYPDHVEQGQTWSDGVHHVVVTQKILSAGDVHEDMVITGTADAEFVSGTSIRLTPDFHAGAFSGNGRFHAHIDPAVGPDGDVVLIAPAPDTAVSGNILHVPKWEKIEIGLQLPQEYQAAIDSFFVHYYADPIDPYVATPGNVDPAHDLNPYADDSLQLVMTLTKPDGTQTLKWGFFMREARWSNNMDTAQLIEDTGDVLHPYHVRFRMAPDQEGPWTFTLSIKAPHTTTHGGAPLGEVLWSGYGFNCDPPLPDNHGPLRVNNDNRRTLKFEDGTPFFGMGVNMPGPSHWYWSGLSGPNWWSTLYKRDLDVMRRTLDQLHEAGANYLRLFLMRHTFAPEWVNLGVYDAFRTAATCEQAFPDSCLNEVMLTDEFGGNCQFQCLAFDLMLEKAREDGIYIQLCIDPYPTDFVYETFLWGPHPYVRNFLEPSSATRPYNVREFFFAGGNTANTDHGVFYYWKRKYKYIMSRWGYSVNIPIIEPFNEIDQTLGYQGHNLSGGGYCDVCPENWVDWPQDNGLRPVINTWLTKIADFVRHPVNVNDPVHSALGESDKLFLVSYAGGAPNDQSYFLPFTNPKVDLLDVHKYVWPDPGQAGQPDDAMAAVFDHAQAFRSHYPSTNPTVPRKPFNHGESNYFTDLTFGGQNHNLEKLFHNYDVSFHNELWSSAFSGNFATGLTWHWERVFWWPDALPVPPHDAGNPFPTDPFQQFSNALGDTNILAVGGLPVPVANRTTYHHFTPLADLLANPNWSSDDLFNSAYTPHKYHDPVSGVECYYLMNADSTLAVGWVHNLNAWVMNSFYLASSNQNFLGCTTPGVQTIAIAGFQPGLDYHISWFPTRMNDTILPAAALDTSGTGTVLLDFSSAPLGGVLNQYLDTLHADYAFIVALQHVPKNMQVPAEEEGPDTPAVGLDFRMFPNPAGNSVTLVFASEDMELEIAVYDLTGQRVLMRSQTTTSVMELPTGNLARGAYAVRVSDGRSTAMKTLILR